MSVRLNALDHRFSRFAYGPVAFTASSTMSPVGPSTNACPIWLPCPAPFLLESLRRRPCRHLIQPTERVRDRSTSGVRCGLCVAWLRTVPRPGGEAHSTFGAGADPEQHQHRSLRTRTLRRALAAPVPTSLMSACLHRLKLWMILGSERRGRLASGDF
jgi:hypothetical protein